MSVKSAGSAAIQTYDQKANVLAANIAATQTATPERLASLSSMVINNAGNLAAKVIESINPKPRT